jgi:hypothetical protein
LYNKLNEYSEKLKFCDEEDVDEEDKEFNVEHETDRVN